MAVSGLQYVSTMSHEIIKQHKKNFLAFFPEEKEDNEYDSETGAVSSDAHQSLKYTQVSYSANAAIAPKGLYRHNLFLRIFSCVPYS